MLFHRKLYNRFLLRRVPFGYAPGTWCGILDIRDFLTQPAILRQEVAERHHRHGGRIGVVCVRPQPPFQRKSESLISQHPNPVHSRTEPRSLPGDLRTF